MASVVAGLGAGAVTGLLAVTFMYSYASVILAGADPTLVPRLTGHFLVGSVVIALVVGVRSQFRGAVALPQDTTTAVLAVMVASIAADGVGDAESLFATVVVVIAVSTFTGALMFWLVGRFRLAILGQYVPYPVVAGFLAAAGWLLFKASFLVMAGTPLDLDDLPALIDVAKLWVPGVLLALALVLASRLVANPLVVPGLIALATAAYQLVRAVAGVSRTSAVEDGWLIEPLGTGPQIEGIELSAVEWSTFADQFGGIATVLIISLIGVLLNVTALGPVFHQEVDVDREMRLLGVANVMAASSGSILGFHVVSLSTLGRRMRGDTRLVAIVVAVICLVSATVGAGWLSYVPQFVLGGLVMFIGLGLMTDWLLRSISKLAAGDLAIVLAIVAVVELVGFLEGVAAGLLIAIVLFVITYSRTGTIRHVFSGREMRSTVDRPTAHRAALRSVEDGIVFVKLQGYVFFASAVGLVDSARTIIAAPDRTVTHLIFDYEHVTGIDASGLEGLMTVHAAARERSVVVVHASVPASLVPRLRSAMDDAGIDSETSPLFSTGEEALEWCENDLLRRVGIDPDDDEFSFDYVMREMFSRTEQIEDFCSRLVEIDLEPGETLIEAGGDGGQLDFVERGRLLVLTTEHGETRLRRAGPGSVVGIAGFFRHGGQTSLVTLRAESACRIRRLSGDAYFRLAAERPEIAAALQRHVLVTISDRYSVLLASYDSVMKGKL